MPMMEPLRSTLLSPAHWPRVQALAREPARSRHAVARRVCEAFDLRDGRGRLRLASCQAVLAEQETAGHLTLPAARSHGGGHPPRGLGVAVPDPVAVPAAVSDVANLRVCPVATEADRRVWTELMRREHPCGAVIHAGVQQRYLIHSDHGVLGALGFAAPALRLAARDRWIGWDDPTRTAALNRTVIGLSRFLIRPMVRCRHLGSRVLSQALRRLAADIEAGYGFRPLLVETFVDPTHHAGTVFAAAGWECVGETTGRGRFAGPDAPRRSVKTIWMRALRRDWRRVLGVVPAAPVPLGPAEGLDGSQWAANEFGDAPLGDRRLSRRLVTCAAVMAADPAASFPAAAHGQTARVTGYYRLIQQPASSDVTSDNILEPHRQRTIRRLAGARTVILIQDGTDLNFATHPKCRNLGLIGRNAGRTGTLGLHMHSSLAVDADTGVPLGLTRIEYDAPTGAAERSAPPAARKSARWLRGLRDAAHVAPKGVRVVAVMDREADFFALFAEQRRHRHVDLVVRAKVNRAMGPHEARLFEQLAAEPPAGSVTLTITRQSARNATGTQKARPGRPARSATLTLRYRSVRIPPPRDHADRHAKPVPMTILSALEESPPEGTTPLGWTLLTSQSVASPQDAQRVLDQYRLRWRIEEWHRIFKTGCRAEFLNHHEGQRLERSLTIKAVIAWRLFTLARLGRDTPELPADTVLDDTEITVLADIAQDRQLTLDPYTLGGALVILAILGGYLNRTNDPPPGPTYMWRGQAKLAAQADAYERLYRMGVLERRSPEPLHQKLRPDKTCD